MPIRPLRNTGLAEESQNRNRELFVGGNAPHALYFDVDGDHRFDLAPSDTEMGWVARRTVSHLLVPGKNRGVIRVEEYEASSLHMSLIRPAWLQTDREPRPGNEVMAGILRVALAKQTLSIVFESP